MKKKEKRRILQVLYVSFVSHWFLWMVVCIITIFLIKNSNIEASTKVISLCILLLSGMYAFRQYEITTDEKIKKIKEGK